jgi:hypothetical protein
VTDWEDLLDRAGMGMGPWVIAARDGECDECGYAYDEGERIRHSDHADGWVCEECGDV